MRFFSWFWGFFTKKPAPKTLITQEQLEVRVVRCVSTIAAKYYGCPPIDGYALIDRENEAMSLFVENCPYGLTKKELVLARKIIKKHQMLFEMGKLI